MEAAGESVRAEMPGEPQHRASGSRSSPPTVPDEARRQLGWFAVVATVSVLAYARSFTGSFQFDDYSVLVAHQDGRLSTLTGFVGFARGRIVPFATLAANYWIDGENPVGYHVVNAIIHLLTTFLVYQLALALCRAPRVRDTWLAEERLPFAVAAAAVFACHPIQVQAVTYVVQRVASMAAMFYVGAVLFYVRARIAELGAEPGRPNAAYAACIVLALAAFLSKENTASLPLAIVLAEYAFFGGKGTTRQLARVAPFVVLVLVIPLLWKLLATGPDQVSGVGGSPAQQLSALVRLLMFRANPSQDMSPHEYFFTQCVVVPHYLALVVIPWGFNVDHDVAVERAVSATVASGFAFLALLLAFGLYAVWRWPAIGFGTVWLFVALCVESSVLPIRDVMVEHRMYLAMPGIALVVGAAFAWGFRHRRTVALALGVAAVIALSALTFARNEVWQTPLTLWSDGLAKSPAKPRVHVNFGLALHRAGRLDEAIAQYCQALAIDPRHVQARVNLDTAVAERADTTMQNEDEIVLERIPNEANGAPTVLAPPDPCRDR